MRYSAENADLLRQLAGTWPGAWSLSLEGADVAVSEDHPLHEEFAALAEGAAASLPFIRTDQVAWITVAPNAGELHARIQDLRAWLFPSYGGEAVRGALVTTAKSANDFAATILRFSPSGYYRWQTSPRELPAVLGKLRQLRRLEKFRPMERVAHIPSLFEARLLFSSALAVGV